MSSNWIVTFSMDQESNPNYFKYSAHIDKKTKELTVYTDEYNGKLEKDKVVDENTVNLAIKENPWSPVLPLHNINRVIISTPDHITFFERESVAVSKPRVRSPFNTKKKRVVKSKSKSKSRRKSRSPRRV